MHEPAWKCMAIYSDATALQICCTKLLLKNGGIEAGLWAFVDAPQASCWTWGEQPRSGHGMASTSVGSPTTRRVRDRNSGGGIRRPRDGVEAGLTAVGEWKSEPVFLIAHSINPRDGVCFGHQLHGDSGDELGASVAQPNRRSER